MNLKKIPLFFFLSIAISLSGLFAQNKNVIAWEDVLEQLSIDNEEVGYTWENEIEELHERIKEPINLNSITKKELEEFPFLNDKQIENILAYLYIHGQMQSIYELQLVGDMDKETIQYLLPFVYVDVVKEKQSLPTLKQILKYGKQELTTRLDIPFYEREGYKGTAESETTYLGHPMYHSVRYAFRYSNHLYIGATAEKDAGEPLFALHNKKGYDYYSFYAYLRDMGRLKYLALGNYRLSYGQGLVVSNDFTIGKSTSANSFSFNSNHIKKHSSTDEYNYFTGIAAAYQWNDWVFSGFYSYREMDGIVTDDAITSMLKTGLHRTRREANRKNVFALQLMGGNVSYSGNNLKLGVTGIYYFFDRPYEPQLREYSKYNLRGNYFHNVGIDYKYRLNDFSFTGETAISKGNNMATVNSIHYSPSSLYSFSVLHRYYSYKYWGLFSRSFSEGGYVQNENGWYLSATMLPVKYWRFFLSVDFFSFPWWRYLVDAPSQGVDFQFQPTYTPHKSVSMYVRYRYKKKEKNYTDEDKVKTVRPIHHHKLRYQLLYAPTHSLSFRTTADYNHLHTQRVSASQGFSITQTVSYTPSTLPLKINIQGTYFQTDDYAARVYAYEKGLLYSFYTPSFYGHGFRYSAHIRWDIAENWMVIAKYGSTVYDDKNEIGSGQDLIEDNKKRDLQLQLRVKF